MNTYTTLMTVIIMTCTVVSSFGQELQIPVDDSANWYCEYYMGGSSDFAEGDRLNGGSPGTTVFDSFGNDQPPGSIVFDDYGNTFLVQRTFIYVVTSDDHIHRVAGLPGLIGAEDGSADRACLTDIKAIVCDAATSTLYVSDTGTAIRQIKRDKNGKWHIKTIAGQVNTPGHKDGPGADALLSRVDGMTFDNKGNLYLADQDWLRCLSPDGNLVTLNPKGGSGNFGPGLERELVSAKFKRIMGAGPLACDENDNIYLADRWNGTWVKINVAAGKATLLAGAPIRSQPGWRKGSFARDGEGNTEAVFHAGGGPSAVAYDRVTKRLYTYTTDEYAVRAILPDGKVRTLGPAKRRSWGHMDNGLLTKIKGCVWLRGCDQQGRVYARHRDDILYRFYRDPAYPNAKKPKTPNPLLPWPKSSSATSGSLGTVKLELPTDGDERFTAGPMLTLSDGLKQSIDKPVTVTVSGKKYDISFDQQTASSGKASLHVKQERTTGNKKVPEYRIVAELRNKPNAEAKIIKVASSGHDPVVTFDGTNFVVAYVYEHVIRAKRVSLAGEVLEKKGIKMGSNWEHRPAIASDERSGVVITGARRPLPNPWGWKGPSTIRMGRLMPDGKTPEQFKASSKVILDGGVFAGMLDKAPREKNGSSPSSKATGNGYWPSYYSTVCWDGKTWVAAWDRLHLESSRREIFACRVDPVTMMPVGQPVRVAGGPAEPGTQTNPHLYGLGNGTSVLSYWHAAPDGKAKTIIRVLAGGALSQAPRIEPSK
jgi:DNA-binding beta-propeller fold protein YncE